MDRLVPSDVLQLMTARLVPKDVKLQMKCYANENEIRRHINQSRYDSCLAGLPPKPSGYCTGTWDELTCWNHTIPGTFAEALCPSMYGFDPTRTAVKYCTENGTWWTNSFGKAWANYTNCVAEDTDTYGWVKFQETMIMVYVIGYATSIVALIAGFIIFNLFRSLQSLRIRIHKYLFASFIIANCSSLAQLYITSTSYILVENHWLCIFLTILNKYAILSNFAWMFCEGLYLHTVLVMPFALKEHIIFPLVMVIGFVVPLLPITLYVILRSQCIIMLDQSNFCWTNSIPQYKWIAMSFSAFFQLVSCLHCIRTAGWCLSKMPSFQANILFLVNILRIVLSKLRAQGNLGDSQHSHKVILGSVKALLILIPMLGGYYIVVTFHKPEESLQSVTVAYHWIYTIVTSGQGFWVACVLCFCNGEVQNAVLLRLRGCYQRCLSLKTRSSTRRTTIVSLNETQTCEGSPVCKSNNRSRNGSLNKPGTRRESSTLLEC